MNDEEKKDAIKSKLQMLVYQEALDILIKKYIDNFVCQEEMFTPDTEYLEKQLEQEVLEKASEKISRVIEGAYKEKFGGRK